MGARRGSGYQQEKLQTFYPGCKPHEGRDLVPLGFPAPRTVPGTLQHANTSGVNEWVSSEVYVERPAQSPVSASFLEDQGEGPSLPSSPPWWSVSGPRCLLSVELSAWPEKPQNSRWLGQARLTVMIISDRTTLHSQVSFSEIISLFVYFFIACV